MQGSGTPTCTRGIESGSESDCQAARLALHQVLQCVPPYCKSVVFALPLEKNATSVAYSRQDSETKAERLNSTRFDFGPKLLNS